MERRYIGENPGAGRLGSVNGNLLEVLAGLDVVLRTHGDNAVLDAVLLVQIELRRNLGAAAEREQHAVGDISLGESTLRGLRAIHCDVQPRVVECLLDAQVRQSGDVAERIEKFVRDLAIAFDVIAVDLDIDRRGKTEVQNLRDDVGGQQVEHDAGEQARQFPAQVANIICRAMMLFVQRDQDVGVARANRSRVAIGVIDGAIGQADIVHYVADFRGWNGLADGGLDLVAKPGRLLNAGTSLGPHMEDELPAVGIGEKVLAEPGNEDETAETDEQKEGDEENAPVHQAGEQQLVGQTNSLEETLEAALKDRQWIAGQRCSVFLDAQQIHRHRGHQRARQDIGGQHGEDDRLRQRNEKITGDPAEKEHGQEDDADAERRDQGGNGNLRGAVEDRVVQRLAFFEVALDVLDGDGGVVDQDADGERQSAEGHDVDGLVQQAENDHRGEDRQGNGDRDDQGAAPAAEKEQDHQAGKRGGKDGFADHSVDRAADKDGLVGERRDLELGRERLLDPGEDAADAVDHVEGGSVSGLEDDGR